MMRRLSRLSLGWQLTLVLAGVTLALHVVLIAIDRFAETEQSRQRERDLAPSAFAVIVPKLLEAPAQLRQSVVRVFSDPASYYVLGAAPALLGADVEDPEFAASVLGWAQRTGVPVTEVIIAERPAIIPSLPPPGVSTERSAIFSLGEPARTALFEGDPNRVPPWVTGAPVPLPGGPGPGRAGPNAPPSLPGGQRPAADSRRPPPPGLLPPPIQALLGPPDRSEGTVHTIAMRLEGTGDWLTLYRLERTPPVNASITKILATVLGTIVVAALGVLVGWRVMRPFRRLAAASEQLGRGERAEPVAAEGPHDVREIITAFNRMGERVSQSAAYQIGLLRSLGHDLKGPLATIRQMLVSVGPETTRQQIELRLERVLAIIGSIMEFSRATMRDGEMEKTDLGALLEVILEEQAELGHAATATVPNRLYVSCRYNAAERMIRNVVENAIKYGGTARASLRAEGDEAVIRVDDDGPGIAEAELEIAFAPFRRISTETEGTGLGLAIARTIAVDHGGSVRLSNRPEGGLRAEIRLPL